MSRLKALLQVTMAACALSTATACAQMPEPAPSPWQELINWATANHYHIDTSSEDPTQLAFLDAVIGDKKLIAFGEGVHGAAEPLRFRNTLFKYLATEHGFTGLANESGIIEGFLLEEFVQGGDGDAEAVAKIGLTYGFGEMPQQAELMTWIRGYNATNGDAIDLSFVGFDVSIASGDASALSQAISYLAKVAPEHEHTLTERTAPFLDQLWVNRVSAEGTQYTGLSQADRDTVTGAISDLISILLINQKSYVAQTSKAEFEAAFATALAARQADRWLRQFPIGWTPEQGHILSSVTAADVAKFENVDFYFNRGPHKNGLMLFAHFGHVAPTSVRIHMAEAQILPLPPMVGEYIEDVFKSDYLVIGHLIGADASTCGEAPRAAPEGSLEAALSQVSDQDFIIDLQSAPDHVIAMLSSEHKLFGTRPTHALSIAQGADALLFTHAVSPAKSCETP